MRSYQANSVSFGGRVDAYEDNVGFVDAFVDVRRKVKILAATLFNYFVQAGLKIK
jgi:hypothetical protein